MKLERTPECIQALIRDWKVDEAGANQILDILEGKLSPGAALDAELISYQGYQEAERCRLGCETRLAMVDALSEGTFGVEMYDPHPDADMYTVAAYYINTGDTYSPTILWDNDEWEYHLTTYGDWLQAWEAANAEEETEAEFIPGEMSESLLRDLYPTPPPPSRDHPQWTHEGTTRVANGHYIAHWRMTEPQEGYPQQGWMTFAYWVEGLDDYLTCTMFCEVGAGWCQVFHNFVPDVRDREVPFAPHMMAYSSVIGGAHSKLLGQPKKTDEAINQDGAGKCE